MDFNLKTYEKLLTTLVNTGYSFQSFEEYIINPYNKVVILRHDVDKCPDNAYQIAKTEKNQGIKASYHFRIVKESWNPSYIRKIVDLGHEIGYHYEDLNFAAKHLNFEKVKSNSDIFRNKLFETAYDSYINNLFQFRQIYPVKVISMHGSPKSLLDSRDLWHMYNYKDSGIFCEVYLDIDYTKVLYLTDTGRCWNGAKYNVRDKITPGLGITDGEPITLKNSIKSTADLIQSALQNELPNHIIINTHPQRWTEMPIPWLKELIFQNVKNLGKFIIINSRFIN